jgi:hypothetical protein
MILVCGHAPIVSISLNATLTGKQLLPAIGGVLGGTCVHSTVTSLGNDIKTGCAKPLFTQHNNNKVTKPNKVGSARRDVTINP